MGARFGSGGFAVTAFTLAFAAPLAAQQPPALEPAAPPADLRYPKGLFVL